LSENNGVTILVNYLFVPESIALLYTLAAKATLTQYN
jgi:hypothetical protein